MSQVFFIGDLHLGHVNIAKYRPEFSSGEEHDEYVKDQIRKCFGKRNIIWFLGDTIFHIAHEDFMNEVCENFQHVHNVLGNHCTEQTMREDIQRRLYAKYNNYHIHGMVSKYGFWLSHAPIHPNELRGKHGVLHGHCIDGDTEIMTANGWKNYNDIKIGDTVITVNSRGLWEDDTVNDLIIHENYDGDAYHFVSRGLNMLVSDKHRVAFKKTSNIIQYEPADIAFNRYKMRIIKSALPDTYTELSLTDDELRLYIWLVADGNLTPTNLCRFRLLKSRKICAIEELLDRMGIGYNKNPTADGGVIISFRMPFNLSSFKIKGLDRKILQCNRQQATIIKETYKISDGNRDLIFTSKKEEADLLQELFIRNGYSVKMHTRSNHGFSKSESYQLSVTNYTETTHTKVSKRIQHIKYTGLMWCIRTNNGNFFARRDGSVFLTGNCHTETVNDSRYLNLSAENINYTPMTLLQIRQHFNVDL